MRFLAASLLIFLTVGQVYSQTPTVGPMDIRRLKILERASENPEYGFWAKVAVQEYKNGLFEGTLDSEGRIFCFPDTMKTARIDDVFKQMSLEVDIATRGAKLDEFVSFLLTAHLVQKYPCNR